MNASESGTAPAKYGDWRDAFSGSASAGLVCRECHALVAYRADHPQRHLAWHDRLGTGLRSQPKQLLRAQLVIRSTNRSQRGRIGAVTQRWPCPCCGYRTLGEGPGDYELCPVCFWEDDPVALRWPLTDEGSNAMRLIEAQRNYEAFAACDADVREKVRTPRADEAREPAWRPLDPLIDAFERSFDDAAGIPWPEHLEALYWWRPTYYRLPGNRTTVPVPRRPASNAAERLMARVLDAVPEAGPIDVDMRRRYEAPAPFVFCGELAQLVLDAYARGESELALRTVTVLNTAFTEDAGDAANGVVIAFLEREEWHEPRMSTSIESWPAEIRGEIEGQIAYAAARRRTS